MNTLPDLGRALARLRRERGMTQMELAALCGMGQSTLARFETGGVAEFGSRKLLRLLEVLGHGMDFVPVKREFTLDDALAQRQRALEGDDGGWR
jgi:HTH-type transcriptional regulator/antitoxin HipB